MFKWMTVTTLVRTKTCLWLSLIINCRLRETSPVITKRNYLSLERTLRLGAIIINMIYLIGRLAVWGFHWKQTELAPAIRFFHWVSRHPMLVPIEVPKITDSSEKVAKLHNSRVASSTRTRNGCPISSLKNTLSLLFHLLKLDWEQPRRPYQQEFPTFVLEIFF
jgi:hypothetical protein